MKKAFLLLFAGIMATSCSQQKTIIYPQTEKTNVVDTYFDTEVPDPYRWLENDTSAATAAWVEAQNRITNDYLSRIPFRNALLNRITELTDYEKRGAPFKKHEKYYFYKNDGLQNQSVLYTQDTPDGEARVFLDPNKLSDDGTVALTGISFSNDGKYMAYTVSRSGSDWREIYVMDIATGELQDDHIQWAKFTGASWRGNGFYYSAYDTPGKGSAYSSMNENHKIYYHVLGQPQSNDKLVYQNTKYPKRFYRASVSEDEKVLFISESGEGHGNALYIEDPKKNTFVQLADNMDYDHYPIEVIGNTIYFFTNNGAPKYRLMTADISKPTFKDWKNLVPESDIVLSNAQVIDNKFFLVYEKDASNRAYVYDLNGKELHEITLPSLGSVDFSGDKDEKDCYFTFASFITPGTIY
ncbi:Prolyl endopeptidase, partial [termite gut metagenome]